MFEMEIPIRITTETFFSIFRFYTTTMGTKFRLVILNFMQFFVWGAWLISIGGYLGGNLHFSGAQIGAVFSTLGIASLFMPTVMGIIADKWMNAERVLGLCHIIGAGLLFWSSTITDPNLFFWAMLLNSMFYMPTIALNNTVSYVVLEQKNYEIVKDFPPIEYGERLVLLQPCGL